MFYVTMGITRVSKARNTLLSFYRKQRILYELLNVIYRFDSKLSSQMKTQL